MQASTTQRTLCVFLLAMSLLILEVALTRIFSFIMFHHFTYLVISTAMLGFGAAGTYLTVHQRDQESEDGHEFLARHAWLFGWATIAAVVLIPRIHFYPLDMYEFRDYSNLISLLLIVVLAGLPFFFGGACIAWILSRAGSTINRIYFADLTGAAAGCLLALFLINQAGAMAACFATAAAAMLVAALSARVRRGRYLVATAMSLLLTALVAKTDFLPLYAPSYKQLFRRESLVELIKWHVITRLDVTRPVRQFHSFGGALSPRYEGDPPNTRFIYQDASALTGIIQPENTPEDTRVLGFYLQGAPYIIRPHADALVIGCGGGVDAIIAMHYGADHVVAVDLNPNVIEMLSGRYKEFAGGVFQRPNVELVVSEGRHFLSRDQRRYDVIQLSGVDTFSALSTGAYALSENFIYTVEALDQYLAHLTDQGIVNFSRGYFNPPREQLKLVTTAAEALERAGAKAPGEHVVVLAGTGRDSDEPWGETLIKRTPFTPEEVQRLSDWTASLGYQVIYDPFTQRSSDFENALRATPQARAAFIDGHPLNITPATDDRPFFFQYYRWSDLWRMNRSGKGVRPPLALIILLGSFILIALLSAGLILYPLARRKESASRPGGRAGMFVYFASLGLGFILVEIALLQKLTIFLGGPAYSMAITLFTILLASGLGSFLSRHRAARPFRLLAVIIPLLVSGVLVESFALDQLMPRLLGFSQVLRCLFVIAMVAPLGLLMGIPFPTGLRYVDQTRPELNPWAWGINACATVMGTLVCILISASLGFRAALWIGAAVYLLGWLVFTATQPRSRTATSSG